MKILAIETSGKLCGTCLMEDDVLLDKLEQNNGLTHSESLMPLIKNLLEKNSLKISNIDGFVCDVGPGSFTGIRIGIASTLAFIDAYENKLFTGVSSLEALASNIKNDGYICSLIDCKNNNCYFSLYLLENNTYKEIIVPNACSIIEMLELVKKYSINPITFVGDGAILHKDLIHENIKNSIFVEDNLNIINTQNLALAGYNKLKNNSTLSLSPLYLKPSQAERMSGKLGK